MKLLVISDLHLEWGQYNPPPAEMYDAVVLAGDVRQSERAVHWARRESTFGQRPVIFVPGNHEYYGSEFRRMRDQLRKAAAGTNVHLLDRDEFVLESGGERVRFLGATLWTDFTLYGPDVETAMAEARNRLNDFGGQIRIWVGDFGLEFADVGQGQRRFRPEDSLKEHALSRAWLAERLAVPTPDECPTIVVTHHAPSHLSVAPQWVNDELTPCFASELPASFFQTPRLWIHGHTHDSFDYPLGNTRVLANPRGYRLRFGNGYENASFDPNLIIEVTA